MLPGSPLFSPRWFTWFSNLFPRANPWKQVISLLQLLLDGLLRLLLGILIVELLLLAFSLYKSALLQSTYWEMRGLTIRIVTFHPVAPKAEQHRLPRFVSPMLRAYEDIK